MLFVYVLGADLNIPSPSLWPLEETTSENS